MVVRIEKQDCKICKKLDNWTNEISQDWIKPVHNGDITPVNLEDNNLPNPDVLFLVVSQKEQVAPLQKKTGKKCPKVVNILIGFLCGKGYLKGGLHTAGQDNDDGRLRASNDHQALPDHQSGGDNHTKRQNLKFNVFFKRTSHYFQFRPGD